LAEGAFRALLAQRGLGAEFQVDSAGTGSWHVDEPPDPRSVAEAKRQGVDISAQRSRQLHLDDYNRFDWIVAMDRNNLTDAQKKRPPEATARIVPFMPYVPESELRDVPDPYYGGPDGFGEVWRLLFDGMPQLLAAIESDEVWPS